VGLYLAIQPTRQSGLFIFICGKIYKGMSDYIRLVIYEKYLVLFDEGGEIKRKI